MQNSSVGPIPTSHFSFLLQSLTDMILQMHILPREVLGISTFGLSMWLLKWFPLKLVDAFILFCSRMVLGDVVQLGLKRPKTGPLQLKIDTGKTPVINVGALAKIKGGQIKVSRLAYIKLCILLVLIKHIEFHIMQCL